MRTLLGSCQVQFMPTEVIGCQEHSLHFSISILGATYGNLPPAEALLRSIAGKEIITDPPYSKPQEKIKLCLPAE